MADEEQRGTVLVPIDWKDPVYNSDGTIDVKINDPILGWTSYRAHPNEDDDHEHRITIYSALAAAETEESWHCCPADQAPQAGASGAHTHVLTGQFTVGFGNPEIQIKGDWVEVPAAPGGKS
jgi:hypothetical protein